MKMGDGSHVAAFDRMKNKVTRAEAVSHAKLEMVSDNIDDRFAQLEKEDEIDKLLAEIKSRRRVS